MKNRGKTNLTKVNIVDMMDSADEDNQSFGPLPQLNYIPQQTFERKRSSHLLTPLPEVSPQLSRKSTTPLNKLRRENSKNLHLNFLSMQSSYDRKKHLERLAKESARVELLGQQLGNSMQKRIDIKAKNNFNSFIKKGYKLNSPQLRRLRSSWKQDYADQIKM